MQTVVGMVKPGGTGSPALVISARLAPLPPSRSFIEALPSAKRYTRLVSRASLVGTGVFI
ncbi:hypothetical protein D3C72_910070 [compost metagenome]